MTPDQIDRLERDIRAARVYRAVMSRGVPDCAVCDRPIVGDDHMTDTGHVVHPSCCPDCADPA